MKGRDRGEAHIDVDFIKRERDVLGPRYLLPTRLIRGQYIEIDTLRRPEPSGGQEKFQGEAVVKKSGRPESTA